VLVGGEGGLENIEMHLVGDGDDDYVARRHGGDDFFVKIGEGIARGDLVEVGIGLEGLAGEGIEEGGVLGEDLEGGGVEGDDADVADEAEPLDMIEGGEDLNLGDHSPADDGDLRFMHGQSPGSVDELREIRLNGKV